MSYTAVQEIISQLEATFAEFDQKVADGTVNYFKTRFDKLQLAIEEFASIRRSNVWGYYAELHGAAGGKGNYELIRYGIDARVEEMIRKSEKLKADKRNIRIAQKLELAGITEVTSTEFTQSKDGFNGVFAVNTNMGAKKVVVDTIFAYGEIQCPHFRVLVKVK